MLKFDSIRQRITPHPAADSDEKVELHENVAQVTTATVDPSQDYFGWVVQSMSDSLVVIGSNGRIAAVNQATLQLLGYAKDDLIGQQPAMLFADGTFRGNGLETLNERGIVQRGEKTLRASDGRHIPVFYSGSVLRDHQGQVKGIVCVAHDATKQKQLEEGLRDALRKERELVELKSRFVTTVSHEFRTPLAIIQTTSDLLRLQTDHINAQEKAASFETIQNQIKHMIRLLDGALTIEQMQTGDLPFHPVPVDLDRLCRDLVEAVDRRVRRDFTYLLQGTNREILADRALIKQAVTSLLSNAIKFSAPDSQVEVTLTCADDTVSVQIRDQGIGIPEDDQARLFEPFFRGSNIGTIGGIGLGLATTRQSIDLHGGTITVDSQENAGTDITVTLPVIPAMRGDAGLIQTDSALASHIYNR